MSRSRSSCYQDDHSIEKVAILKECKLTKLEDRRKRGDLLETHKIMHGLEKILEIPSLQELILYEGGTV